MKESTEIEQLSALLRRKPLWLIAVSILLGMLFNVYMEKLNTLLKLPFFFDSIATATVAALFGPIPGVILGFLTNLFQEVINNFEGIYYPWGLCGASTGLIVGLMARSNRFNKTIHAILATVFVTLSNSILGSIIATFLFGGITGVQIDYLVTGLIAAGQSIMSSTFLARLPSNVIDKASLSVVPDCGLTARVQ